MVGKNKKKSIIINIHKIAIADLFDILNWVSRKKIDVAFAEHHKSSAIIFVRKS